MSGNGEGVVCLCCTEPMGNDTGDTCSFCVAWCVAEVTS